MEIPQSMINNRQRGVEFYNKLKSNLEKLQLASMKEVASKKFSSEKEKETMINITQSFYHQLIKEVEVQRDDYYKGISDTFNAIHQMDQNNLTDEDGATLRTASDRCISFSKVESNANLQILSRISSDCIYAEETIPDMADVYYEGINEIIGNMFNCTMDKSRARAVDGHKLTKYPIFDKSSGRRLINEEYQPIL